MDQRRTVCQRLVERDDRCLGGNLDRDLFGEILGLSRGVGNHRSDRLANIVDALVGEDRLCHWDIIRTIKPRTDRVDVAEDRRSYDRHFRGRVHRQDTATRYRAAHKAQFAGAPRQINGVAAAPQQQRPVFIARQRSSDPPHLVSARTKIPARSQFSSSSR